MAAETKNRKDTEQGLGAVRSSQRPPAASGDFSTEEAVSRMHVRRDTKTGVAPPPIPAASTSPAPVAPRSAPPPGSGRYSAQKASDPVRVDAVGATTIVARRDSDGLSKPRVVARTRVEAEELDASEEFILSLVDDAITMPALVEAAELPQHEVMATVARLVRRGLLSLSK